MVSVATQRGGLFYRYIVIDDRVTTSRNKIISEEAGASRRRPSLSDPVGSSARALGSRGRRRGSRGGCEEGEANRAEEAVEGLVVESEGPRGRGAVAACLW